MEGRGENKPPRVNILGVGVHATHLDGAVSLVEEQVSQGEQGYICVTNVHGIMESQEDAELRRIHNESWLTVPDGMPAVWFGRLRGHRAMGRVFGPDFMLAVCRESVARGRTHYLYGGGDGVAERLKAELERRFPGIRIVGAETPPFRPLTEAEEKDLRERIERISPDYFWIGLGLPKQERFAASHMHLNARILIGVGAAFDIHSGRFRDAPPWIKRSGLQWVHRLWQEPRRLWRRYLYHNPRFVVKAALQLTGVSRYSLRNDG